MSGTGSGPGGGPHEAGSAADPSMEDILASIRRILNEDEVAPDSPAARAGDHAPPVIQHDMPNAGGSGGDDGVLMLDEAMLVPMPSHDAAPPVRVSPAQAAPAAVMPSPGGPSLAAADGSAAAMPVNDPVQGGGIMGDASSAAATASVGALLRQLSSERSTQIHRGGPTIEDLVREEVRPLLKDWLDAHLPPLVERLVRQEIERVTGRAIS